MNSPSGFVSVADLGAVPGIDCAPLVNQAIANGAPCIYYPAGQWTQNNVDLTGGGTRWKIAVRGASPAATSIWTSIPGANVFEFCPTASPQEPFLDLADFEMVSGPGYATAGATATPRGGQVGAGIVVVGPTIGGVEQEISHGRYSNLWAKNFNAALVLQQHNDATISDLAAEYCNSALVATDCGDLDCLRVKAQNGYGTGIILTGTPAGQANHMAEGARLVACSANGQTAGITVSNYSFVDIAAGCFSSAENIAGYFVGLVGATIAGGNWQGLSANGAMQFSATCKWVKLIGAMIYDSPFGINLAGSGHSIHGCLFTGNTGPDLILAASGCDIVGGQFLSSGAPNSIEEISPAANNRICGVIAAKTIALLAGNGSTAS